MMERRTGEIAALLGADLRGADDVLVQGVAFDSREVAPGNLFVALPGERADGHAFVGAAAARGAAAALVARPCGDAALPQLVVTDTLDALQRLAADQRYRGGFRLAAVTGSVGKTSTKEHLAAFLATTFPTGATRDSRNSQAGFPTELCNQPEGIAWMVAELGMNHPGELDRLGRIARPDALLYTVVAPVHLEFFPDLDAIAEAKAELIPHLAADGVLVLNAADRRVAALAPRFAGRVVTYGAPGVSHLWIEDYRSRGLLGSTFSLCSTQERWPLSLPLPGRHSADNVLAAAACALSLGVPPESLPPRAATLTPPPRRGVVHRLPSGITVVDDSYNASPVAVQRLLELLGETPGRRVAVLGEMLELGAGAPAFHAQVGAAAGQVAAVVVAVGGSNAEVLARAAAPAECRVVRDAAGAADVLSGLLRPGDVVLVKGSRGVGLDRVVDALVEAG